MRVRFYGGSLDDTVREVPEPLPWFVHAEVPHLGLAGLEPSEFANRPEVVTYQLRLHSSRVHGYFALNGEV